MHIFKTSLLFSALAVLLSACGGGGDSGTGGSTGGGGTGGGTGGNASCQILSSKVASDANSAYAARINYVEADADAAYTGLRQLANLTTNNAGNFIDLLFDRNGQTSPVNPYPYDLKGNPQAANMPTDFLRTQEEVIRRLEQRLFANEQVAERVVDQTEVCDNGGTLTTEGEIDDVAQKSKLRMRYNNCEVNGYIMDGDAYTFLYKYSQTHNQPESILLSYDNMSISSPNNNYQVTGTIQKIADFAADTERYITELFRWNAAAGTQSLLDILRYDFGDGYTQMIGDDNTYTGIYDGFYGRARVETKGELVYGNVGNTPTQGEILLTGQGNSKVYLTATGNGLLVDVDADGDGSYECTDQPY